MHTLRCSRRRSGPHTRLTYALWQLCLLRQLGCSFPLDREAFQNICRDMGVVVDVLLGILEALWSAGSVTTTGETAETLCI
jgi:hypothetical protein